MENVSTQALKFEETLKSASSVLIGTHLNPDGDALGSALALSHYLDDLGIENEVVCHHPAPRNLQFLPGVQRVRQVPKEEKHDLAVMLDLGVMDRLGSTEPYLSACPRLMVIDHHIPHEEPGDVRIVDIKVPATALLLARMLIELGATITKEMATCLLTGIVTDTGSFRFRNTTAEALAISATLLERGGDLVKVSEEIFQTKPLASAKLLGIALDHLHLSQKNQLAWSALTVRDFEEVDAKDEDTEGFVNELLSIETVQIAAIFREPKPGKVRCSLRSRGEFDVASVARTFGGGGHRNAAGCTFDDPLPVAVEAMLKRLKECLASS